MDNRSNDAEPLCQAVPASRKALNADVALILASMENDTGGTFFGSIRIDYKASVPVHVAAQRHEEMRTRPNMSPKPVTRKFTDAELLRDIRTVFQFRCSRKLPSKLLVNDLVNLSPRWSAYNRGLPISQHALATVLKRLDKSLVPRSARVAKNDAALAGQADPTRNLMRAYDLADFEPVFARILGRKEEPCSPKS
jgi:Protein of unknown function (DUF3631)